MEEGDPAPVVGDVEQEPQFVQDEGGAAGEAVGFEGEGG